MATYEEVSNTLSELESKVLNHYNVAKVRDCSLTSALSYYRFPASADVSVIETAGYRNSEGGRSILTA